MEEETIWEAAERVLAPHQTVGERLCSKEDALKNVATMARIAVSLGATWAQVHAVTWHQEEESLRNGFEENIGE